MTENRADRTHVGLSGWDYPGWKGDFYPLGLPARARLQYVAERFDTVEINASFYALQDSGSYQRWYDATPNGFLFALKGGRYITHLKRLRGVEPGLANFFASGPLALREKLGPVLWQLPANLTFDAALIDEFLSLLPRSTVEAGALAGRHDDKLRYAPYLAVDRDQPMFHVLEVRHRSYDNERFYQLLSARGVACVISDSPTWPQLDRRTSAHTYVRLHGHTQLYASGYSSRNLNSWALRCKQWASEGPVFVYFDNDARGRAPHDALGLMSRLGKAWQPAQ
ncbi:MAG: DUF72 domain-containing protein [Actinomycetes bacterium]